MPKSNEAKKADLFIRIVTAKPTTADKVHKGLHHSWEEFPNNKEKPDHAQKDQKTFTCGLHELQAYDQNDRDNNPRHGIAIYK